MALSQYDVAIGQAARYLLAHGNDANRATRQDLATRLMSCEVTKIESLSATSWITITCPRDVYELLWPYNNKGMSSDESMSQAEGPLLASALRYAGGRGTLHVNPEYGAVKRTAQAQSELSQFVFGDDPVGQQVQVLDVGKHSAPTRQLLVSPIPVLPVDDLKRDERLVFVVMPFAPEFRPVYDAAITPAITASGLTSGRGDDINQPGAILTQVWHAILSARLVIADLSGANGNVLYELGLAHVVGHEAILLTQHIENVPFDLRHQRVIVYDNTPAGLEALRTQLTAAIQTALASSRR